MGKQQETEKRQKTEEELKTEIFDAYLKFRCASSSVRRQVYFERLNESVFSWCKNYHLRSVTEMGSSFPIKEAHQMGAEIYNAVRQLVKEGKSAGVLKDLEDKDKFFRYFKKILKRQRAAYYRNSENKPGVFQFPRILANMERVIEMQQNNAGRKFSEEEKLQSIVTFFPEYKKNARIYLKMMDTDNSGRYYYFEGAEEKNILDSIEIKRPYMPAASDDPQKICQIRYCNLVIQKAVEKVLDDKKNKKNRDIFRALFTLHCIDASLDLESMAPILDNEILKAYREKKKIPDKYEILLKYRPNLKISSAKTTPSDLWNRLCGKLRIHLKEEFSDIFMEDY